MGDAARCTSCGREIPADAPGGACPRCALAGALPVADPGPTPEEVAAKLPAFEILGVLGRGGMGVVFKARQKALDRIVALKVLPPASAASPGFADRFQREAKAMARLAHPNIVAVHEFGETGGLFYLVLEFVDGVNVREAMTAGRIRPDDALTIVPQICDALQYAHDRGVVHRDIKPENVLIGRDGRVKIADFGLAKLADREAGDLSLTGAGQVMGTLRYMAPEQWERPKEVDHRADIYSLGVVFYEMLTGELPVGKFEPPSSKASIDVRVDAVVMRSIERDRERRWQHASDVKTKVDEISSMAAAAAPAAPPSDVDGGGDPRRHRVNAIACFVGAFLSMLGVAATNQSWLWFLAAVLGAAGAWCAAWHFVLRRRRAAAARAAEPPEPPETPESLLASAAESLVVAVVAGLVAVFAGPDFAWLWWCAGPAALVGLWCASSYWIQRRRDAPPAARPEIWMSPFMVGLAASGVMAVIASVAWARWAWSARGRDVADSVVGTAGVLGALLLVLVIVRAVQARRHVAGKRGPLGPPVLLGVASTTAIGLAVFCLVYSLATVKREQTVELPPGVVYWPPPATAPEKPAADDREPWAFKMETASGEDPEHVPSEADRQDVFKAWSRAQALQGVEWANDRAGLYDDDDRKMIEAMAPARRKAAATDGSLGLPYLDRAATKSPLAKFRIDRVRFGVWTGSKFESATVWAGDGVATLRFQMRRGYVVRGGVDLGWFFAASPVEIE